MTWDNIENVTTGDVVMTFPGDFMPDGYPGTVSYSADGRWLATPLQAGADSRIAIWDTTTWEEISTIPGSFQAVAFSSDGRWLAASHSWDILIWDVATVLSTTTEKMEGIY